MDTRETEKEKKKYTNQRKITIYIPPGLHDRMKAFQKEHDYISFSSLVRAALRTHEQVFINNKKDEPFREKIMKIERRTEAILLELKLKENRENAIRSEMEKTEMEFNFDEVADEMLSAISNPELFAGSVKDFVIIDFFKDTYSRGVIFHVLSELKKQGKLELKNGVWTILNGKI